LNPFLFLLCLCCLQLSEVSHSGWCSRGLGLVTILNRLFFLPIPRKHLEHQLGILSHKVDNLNPFGIIQDFFLGYLGLLRLSCGKLMHVIVLHLMNFAFLPLSQVLIFLFKVLNDLGVVDLFGALFIDLLLCHLLDL
jgi:hypothetical protein